MNDWSLLQEYISRRSNSAFAELVHRHVGMVYGTALRQVRDAHGAQDVTQAVFILLARKAASLSSSVVIGGWLFRTASLLSLKYLRDEQRRRAREKESSAMPLTNDADAQVWEQIAPHLDEALAQLSSVDRDSIVLRFLEQRSFREVAEALRISEDAAKKRVSRALEKLRAHIHRRGITVSLAALSAAMAANGVASVPSALESLCVSNALGNGPITSASVESLLRDFILPSSHTAVKWVIGVAAVLVVSFFGIKQFAKPNAAPITTAAAVSTAGNLAGPEVSTQANAAAVENVASNVLVLRVVRASDGGKIPGAEVRTIFYGTPSRISTLHTDEEGVARIELPSDPATFNGMAFWIGEALHVPLCVAWDREEAPNLPREYTIRLAEGNRLMGRVVDEEGNGVAAAKLSFNGKGKEWTSREYISYVNEIARPVTDAQGYWEGNFFPADIERISGLIEHPDYAITTFSKETKVTDSESPVIVLQRGVSISGTVKDAEGNAVPSAKVELQDLSGWRDRRRENAAVDGQFEFDRVAEGEFALRVTATDYKAASVRFELAKAATNLTVTLHPVPRFGNAVLRGRVLTDAGRPLRGIGIHVEKIGAEPGKPLWSGETDSAGRFEWKHAPEGVLKVAIAGGTMGHKILDLAADGSEHEVRFAESAQVKLSGKVIDAKSRQSVRNAKVMFEAAAGAEFGRATPDWLGEAYEGSFVFMLEAGKIAPESGRAPFFPPGRPRASSNAVLYVDAPGYRRTTLDLPRQTNDIEVTVELHPAAIIEGRVILANGQPASGAQLAFSTKTMRVGMDKPGQLGKSHDPNLIARATAGADGSFTLGEAPFNGTRVVAVHEEGWANVSIDTLPDQPIVLNRWGHVGGISRIAARPGEKLEVTIRTFGNAAEQIIFNYYGELDSAGRFAFDKVPAGEVQVALMHRRGNMGVWSNSKNTSVRAGETANVVLGDGGVRVTGRVQLPKAHADLDWANSGQHLSPKQRPANLSYFDNPPQSYGFFCEPDGSFVVEGVVPGEYRLMLTANRKQFGSHVDPGNETLAHLMTDLIVGESDVDLGTIVLESVGEN